MDVSAAPVPVGIAWLQNVTPAYKNVAPAYKDVAPACARPACARMNVAAAWSDIIYSFIQVP